MGYEPKENGCCIKLSGRISEDVPLCLGADCSGFLELFDVKTAHSCFGLDLRSLVVQLGVGAVELSAIQDVHTAAAGILDLEEAIAILQLMTGSRLAFGREGFLDGNCLADIRGEAFYFLSYASK